LNLRPNIFVQIGLYTSCELAEITKDPQLFQPKDSLSSDEWTLPQEVLDRIGDKRVVGIDLNYSSVKYCKNKYKYYKNVDFIHAAIGDKQSTETITTHGWSIENRKRPEGWDYFSTEPQEAPVFSLPELFEKLHEDGDIIVCVMDVEGYESKILQSHDWKIKPYCFVIEGHITYRTNLCISILLNNGYYLCDYSMHYWALGYIKAIRKDILVHPTSGKHLGDDWELDEG